VYIDFVNCADSDKFDVVPGSENLAASHDYLLAALQVAAAEVQSEEVAVEVMAVPSLFPSSPCWRNKDVPRLCMM
jgi:hypothetical protein